VEKMWKREQHGGRGSRVSLERDPSRVNLVHLQPSFVSAQKWERKIIFYFLQPGHSPIVNHKRIFHMDRFCSVYGQAIAWHLLLMDYFFPHCGCPYIPDMSIIFWPFLLNHYWSQIIAQNYVVFLVDEVRYNKNPNLQILNGCNIKLFWH